MIIDKELHFSEAQTITTTAVSTNVINTGGEQNGAELGEMKILIQLKEAFTAAGAATLTIALQESDDEAFTSPTSYTLESAAAVAGLTKDKNYVYSLPAALSKKYIRLNYTVATGPMTAGKLTAALVDDYAAKKAFKGV